MRSAPRPLVVVQTCLAVVLLALTLPSRAADSTAQATDTELQAAFRAAGEVAQVGPTVVKLGDQAALKLPEGHVYVPPKESAGLMRAMGNHSDDRLLGLVFPRDTDEGWFVVMEFDAEGYIKDDDAKDWNADELLQSVKEGTEESNKDRVSRGIAPIEVIGWVQKPVYDPNAHQLVWALSSKDKGAPADAEQGINYNTYALGREGYISMNLVTDLRLIDEHRGAAKALLAGLSFNDGKRYADFNASTDKVAAYGLAALVGGVAAKKLGLLAALGVFLAKFWKLIAIAVFGGGGVLAKVFRRKKTTETTAA